MIGTQGEITANIELPVSTKINKNANSSGIFFEKLVKFRKIIVFSPHLDDAVLSMGSLLTYLLSRGIDVEVISFFTTGSSLTSSSIKIMMDRAGFNSEEEYFLARRVEDGKALKSLGQNIKYKHLGFTDAAWRADQGVPLYPETQLGEIAKKDSLLIRKIVEKLQVEAEVLKDSIIFAPVARGKHVDHQLVRNIADEFFSQVIFYEDFPYSGLHGGEDEFVQSRKLKEVEWYGDYELKKQAILKYKSQKVSLFFRGTMHLPFEKYFVSSL